MSPTRLEGVAVVRERATSHGLVGPSRNRFILVRGDGLPSYSIWSPAMNETRAPDSSSRTHCRRRTSVCAVTKASSARTGPRRVAPCRAFLWVK
jgi:hypothetical protein